MFVNIKEIFTKLLIYKNIYKRAVCFVFFYPCIPSYLPTDKYHRT